MLVLLALYRANGGHGGPLVAAGVLGLSLLIASVSYAWIEVPAMSLGRWLAARFASQRGADITRGRPASEAPEAPASTVP
jgi:peptidoglycan/LPS O-acetylase OafA/YrhL